MDLVVSGTRPSTREVNDNDVDEKLIIEGKGSCHNQKERLVEPPVEHKLEAFYPNKTIWGANAGP